MPRYDEKRDRPPIAESLAREKRRREAALVPAPERPEPIANEVQKAAQKYTDDAIDLVAFVMRDAGEDTVLRVRCAKILLDRGWGPPAPMEQPPLLTPAEQEQEQMVFEFYMPDNGGIGTDPSEH